MQKHKHKQGHRDDAQAQGNTSIYMGDTKTKAKGINERHKDKDKRYMHGRHKDKDKRNTCEAQRQGQKEYKEYRDEKMNLGDTPPD